MGPLLRRTLAEILARHGHRTGRHVETRMPRQHVGEGALAGAVGAHHGMDFAGGHIEIEAVQNGLPGRLDVQPANAEQAHPTLPSRLTSSSLAASTANSIGSVRNTSLQKPLTIMATAFSVSMPRCWQRNS